MPYLSISNADIIIIIIVFVGIIRGYQRGFLISLITLIALAVGLGGGVLLLDQGIHYLDRYFNIHASILPVVSFLLLFFVIVFLIVQLGKMLRRLIEKTILGSLDKIAGALLGGVKFLILISAFIALIDFLGLIDWNHLVGDSPVFQFTAQLVPRLINWVT